MGDLIVGLLVAQALILGVLLLVGRLLFPWILGTKDVARELRTANDLKRQELAQRGGVAPQGGNGAAPTYVVTPHGVQLQK